MAMEETIVTFLSIPENNQSLQKQVILVCFLTASRQAMYITGGDTVITKQGLLSEMRFWQSCAPPCSLQ
jgi:hypothetical protein